MKGDVGMADNKKERKQGVAYPIPRLPNLLVSFETEPDFTFEEAKMKGWGIQPRVSFLFNGLPSLHPPSFQRKCCFHLLHQLEQDLTKTLFDYETHKRIYTTLHSESISECTCTQRHGSFETRRYSTAFCEKLLDLTK